MSNYRITPLKDTRVLNYRFSVDTKTAPEYLKLKKTIKVHNENEMKREASGLKPHYLRVRGRGRNPIVSGPQNRYSVKDDNASFFDVYVQRDTDAMHKYTQRTAKVKAFNYMTDSMKAIRALVKPASIHA